MDSMDVDDPFHAKLFSRAPIYDLVFSSLSPRSLVQVALTCRAAYLAVTAFKSRAFNVNRHLSRYFTDPIAFRSLQARTNTLISGSNALQFLDRSFYPEADLDLYTHPGHSREVAQFLLEAQGYQYVPRDSQERDWKEAIADTWDGTTRRIVLEPLAERVYPNTGVNGVWSFEKKTGPNQCLTVQIVEARSSPVECIFGFHSTCVMNFISSDAAYALYPVATFEHRSALGLPTSRHRPEAVGKYVQRGWRIYFIPPWDAMENPSQSPFLLGRVRQVGDKHTWVVPLDQTGVQPRPPLSHASAPLTFDPVLLNGWTMVTSRGTPLNGYECDYYPLQTTLFRYNYAIPNEKLQKSIRDWAHEQGKYMHEQLSKENWVWFDSDLPGFLRMNSRH